MCDEIAARHRLTHCYWGINLLHGALVGLLSGVDTFPGLFGDNIYFTMKIRRDSKQKFSGERFFRLLAKLGTILEISPLWNPERLF